MWEDHKIAVVYTILANNEKKRDNLLIEWFCFLVNILIRIKNSYESLLGQ